MILTEEQYQKFTLDVKNSVYEYGEPYAYLEVLNEAGEFYGAIKKYLREHCNL